MSAGAKDIPARQARSVARLAAVQALYQMELAGEGVETVIKEFSDHRFDATFEDEWMAEADEAYFAEIVRGVVADQGPVDAAVTQRLAEGWKLARLDSTLRAILRAGVYELMKREDVPVPVIVSEYVDIAKAFYSEDEPKLVNAVLDRVSRRVRGEGRGKDAS